MLIRESSSRKSEYNNYLKQHIGGVIESFEKIVVPYLIDCGEYDDDYIGHIATIIQQHDKSKYESIEYFPYLNYFYPENDEDKDENAFDLAWLHHQKRNPHHWQYWCIIRDSGEIVPMDMEFIYIIEMCCDWHSFSKRDPKSTAKHWYDTNKNKMIFSDYTRETVEKIIGLFDKPLEGE